MLHFFLDFLMLFALTSVTLLPRILLLPFLTLSYPPPLSLSLCPLPRSLAKPQSATLATWRRNVLNFYSWICYASLFLSVCMCVYVSVCVFVLSKFEFDWKACDTAAANRQRSSASARPRFTCRLPLAACRLPLPFDAPWPWRRRRRREASWVLPSLGRVSLDSCALLRLHPAMSSAV